MLASCFFMVLLSLLGASGAQSSGATTADQGIQTVQTADNLEVVIETRIVKLGDISRQFQNLAGFKGVDADSPVQPGSVVFLNPRQVTSWMVLFRDHRAKVMQAPTCTLDNGQQANIDVGDQLCFLTDLNMAEVNGQKVIQPLQTPVDTGLRSSVLPAVSADCQFVKLRADVKLVNVDENVPLLPVQTEVGSQELTLFIQQPRIQKLSLAKTVNIPEGGTAVFYMGAITEEVQEEFGSPILSKIPYINRLFTNTVTGRTRTDVYLMVTTRVLADKGTIAANRELDK